MRHWLGGAALAGLTALFLVGCEGDSSSKGFSSVTITDEEKTVVPVNRCAIKGHATNTGNRRAHVRITYEGKKSGTVIATSSADFEVAAFSNFNFTSSAFVPPVSCGTIDDVDRKSLDVEAA
jgi:hypothetical protein